MILLILSTHHSKAKAISVKKVGLLKIVGEIQELVRKRSQKINYDIILHYISLRIYPLHFPKLSVFGENDSRRLCNFL